MKKNKYSSPYYARDYFSKDILPTEIYAGQKTIRQSVPFRRHDDLELMLVRSGEGTVTINAHSFPVSRGSLLCFNPSHFHKLEPGKGGKLEISECHINPGIYFYITACPYYKADADKLSAAPELARLDEIQTENAEGILERLANICTHGPVDENQPLFFLLLKLFGMLEKYAFTPSVCAQETDSVSV